VQFLAGAHDASLLRNHPEVEKVVVVQPFHPATIRRIRRFFDQHPGEKTALPTRAFPYVGFCDGILRNDRLVAPDSPAYNPGMGSAQKMTAQGVRDLNHTGPRIKPDPSSAAASAPMLAIPGAIEEAPPALESIAASDQTAGSPEVAK
jgi:hypothetical protein